MLVKDGISLTKFWFSVSPAEQRTRFTIRQVDPVRQWKLSPTGPCVAGQVGRLHRGQGRHVRAHRHRIAPWTVVKSNDKKRARVNAMRHVLGKFDYDGKDHEVVGQADPLIVGRALPDTD